MNPRRKTRLAVLLSGRGSNFVALADALARGTLGAEIVLVISNRRSAGGLAAARARGIPTLVLAAGTGDRRQRNDRRLADTLRAAAVDWVCLAGYLRMIGPAVVAAFPQRILNIHPSLLPAFPGLDAVRQALAYGVSVTGCTVHLVDGGLDSGPIVLQRAVCVEAGDDEASLAARILVQEHQAYAEALRRLLVDAWHLEGRRLVFAPPPPGRSSREKDEKGLTRPSGLSSIRLPRGATPGDSLNAHRPAGLPPRRIEPKGPSRR